MERILTHNWQLRLLSQVRRGSWFLEPSVAESSLSIIDGLFSKDAAFIPVADTIQIKAQAEGAPVSTLNEDTEKDVVCIIPIRGTMLKYGTLCSYGADEYAAMMDCARLHPKVRGVVLDIDSGGGEAAAVPVLIQAVRRLQQDGKPVVASVDFCGSAAYWLASTCDRVYANNAEVAQIGSIGAMAVLIDDRKASEEAGYKRIYIFAPQSSDKNRAYIEALDGNPTSLQEASLRPLAQAFIDAVKVNRSGKLKEDTPGLLSGAVFFAEVAEAAGLIDGVRTLEQAVQIARELAEINSFTQNS